MHACGFNYRFVPAIRRARELLEAGAVGEIVHFRARYLQSWGWDADTSIWRFDRAQAATGRDRRPRRRTSSTWRASSPARSRPSPRSVRTYVPGHEVDDAFTAVDRALETARSARSRRRGSRAGASTSRPVEINGSDGSIAFDLERFDELVSSPTAGRDVLVIERAIRGDWWPPGHSDRLGRHVHARVRARLDAIAGDGDVAPYCATFEDGYRAAEVCDAILRSSAEGSRISIAYRSL